METLEQVETGRNPDGTFKPGFSGNPGGRPKNTLRAYLQMKIDNMSPEQMEQFLSKVSPELQWQMAEGRPQQDITSDGKALPTPLYVPGNNSPQEDKPPEEKN